MGNLMIAAQGVVNLQGGSLQLPNGASVSTGGTLETSGATLELADNLTVSGTWNATGDTLRLLDNTSLSTTTPVTLETLDLNGANLELATATTSLTVQNAFTLDNSTLHTNNGSLTLASPTEIHSLLDSTGGTLEFQQGGTVSGTVNAQGSTLKLGGNLAVPGTLQMHLEATLDADMASLDLSGGTFELGGVLPLDQVQTDNLTKLKLLEDATVTRNEGFVVGAVDFAEFTLTLGSAATDLTLEVPPASQADNGSTSGDSGDNSSSVSQHGLATQEADLTVRGLSPSLNPGFTLSSTGGILTFSEGISIVGGSLDLQDTTLALRDNFSNTAGAVALDNVDLDLLDNLSLQSDSELAFREVRLNQNTLNLQALSGFSVAELLVLDHPQAQLVWDNTSLSFDGGLRLDPDGVLAWRHPSELSASAITLNGGRLEIGSGQPQAFALAAGITLPESSSQSATRSTLAIDNSSTLAYNGPAISLNHTLTFAGGGTFENTNPMNLNSANAQLVMQGGELDRLSTESTSMGVNVDNESTISNLSLNHVTPVQIAADASLSGSITVNSGGTLKLTDNGTFAADLTMSGGTLDVAESQILSGGMAQSGDATVTVASGKSLILPGDYRIGPHALTLQGAGLYAFSDNASAVVLNDADSLLNMQGSGRVQALKVAAVSNEGKGLNHTGSMTIGRMALVADMTLAVQNEVIVEDAVSVENIRFKLQGPGVLRSSLILDNSTLEILDSLTLAGNLEHRRSSTIQINSGAVLMASGETPIAVNDQTLTLTGTGTLTNAQAVVLNDNASRLVFSGTNSVDNVTVNAAPDAGAGLVVQETADSTVNTLTLNTASQLVVASGSKLSVSNPLTIPEGGLSVDGAGTLQVYDALQLNGTLAVTDSTLILEGVAVELGADLMVGGSGSLTTDSTTELSLLDNATLSAPGLLVLQSLDVESHTLTLDNVTGLTVQDSFNLSGSAGLRSDRADLTFHGVVSVNNTGFQREGGDLTLNAGGSFVQGLNLDNTTLELGGDLALSGEVRTNIGTVLSLGGNSLSFNSVSLQTDGPLDLSGTSIDNQTTLHLRGDTPLTHDAPFVLNSLELAGHTLTLQSATTGLTVLQALTLGNATDRLVKNEADLILAQPLTLAQGQLISTGGVLRLAQGAVLEDSTELDLTA
ncbi:MAG: hypothetical protein QGF03_07010, partial [SAR324 cluster bacterium]|nr:hypothetical protein [SAR324 cluster bacterium]